MPLLVLYAISKLFRGESRLLPFTGIDENPGNLSRELGPKQKAQETQPLFWWLQNEGIWEIPGADRLNGLFGRDVNRDKLFWHEASGGFTDDIFRQLQVDTSLALEITQNMLAAHIPSSIHKNILQAVGSELTLKSLEWTKRDPNFRVNVLKA